MIHRLQNLLCITKQISFCFLQIGVLSTDISNHLQGQDVKNSDNKNLLDLCNHGNHCHAYTNGTLTFISVLCLITGLPYIYCFYQHSKCHCRLKQNGELLCNIDFAFSSYTKQLLNLILIASFPLKAAVKGQHHGTYCANLTPKERSDIVIAFLWILKLIHKQEDTLNSEGILEILLSTLTAEVICRRKRYGNTFNEISSVQKMFS